MHHHTQTWRETTLTFGGRSPWLLIGVSRVVKKVLTLDLDNSEKLGYSRYPWEPPAQDETIITYVDVHPYTFPIRQLFAGSWCQNVSYSSTNGRMNFLSRAGGSTGCRFTRKGRGVGQQRELVRYNTSVGIFVCNFIFSKIIIIFSEKGFALGGGEIPPFPPLLTSPAADYRLALTSPHQPLPHTSQNSPSF